MLELNIISDFTIGDIHKIREYHYKITKNMSVVERRNYYKIMADKAKEKIAQLRVRN